MDEYCDRIRAWGDLVIQRMIQGTFVIVLLMIATAMLATVFRK